MFEEIKKIKTGDFVCNDTNKRPRIRRESTERTKGRKRGARSFDFSSLLVRTAVCVFLFGVVLLIAYLDAPFAKKVKTGLVSALTFEIDVDKSLGKLKFVQENNSTIQNVMSSSEVMKMELPVKKGALVSNYTEGGMMFFEALELTDVVSPSAGIVENVTSEKEFQITVDHGNDVKSVLKFGGAMAVIKEGNVLKKGDYIGIVDKGTKVGFGVIKNGQNVDPAEYLEKNE